MNPSSQRPLPPVFSSEQEQNKAECAAIWYTYANHAEKEQDLLGARMGFMCAWREQPEELRYFLTLVNFLERSGFVDELFKVYEIGVQLHSGHLPTLVNYSKLLNDYGSFEEAKAVAELALMKDSHCLPAWGNLGNAFRGMGDFDNAASSFEKVLKDAPGNDMAAFNLGSIYLSLGDFEKGFYHYNRRLNLIGYERLQGRNKAPIWNGECLQGKTVLVFAEQGLGDSLMFSRYLELLLDLGASEVYFEVQKPLLWIVESMGNPRIHCLERGSLDEPLGMQTDFQFPLLSLASVALREKCTLQTAVPYFDAPVCDAPRAVEKIVGIGEFSKLRVGLCWQGNPHATIDCGRSFSLAMLEPLLMLSEIDFLSLQRGDGLEQIEAAAATYCNFHYLEQLDGDTRAFEETLEMMKGLDLVVTTDTAIAHLAGALGKPCWVLLQKYPEWRWGLEGENCIWYPQVRLFRQDTLGDWDAVIARVEQALKMILA